MKKKIAAELNAMGKFADNLISFEGNTDRGEKMKKKITTGLIAVWMMAGLALVAGCAVQKNWVATGGSKADGTIQLSYQYGAFQKPELDENQGLGLAIERCSAWGYSQAEAFGGTVQNCQSSDSYGSCNSWLVTKEYQCID